MADIEQTKKIIPCVEFVFGVNIIDLVLGFQIDPVEQTIKSNSVGSGRVFHRSTSPFDYHFDDSFIVFKDVQLRFIWRRMCVSGYIVHIGQLINFLPYFDILGLNLGTEIRTSFPDAIVVGLDIVVGGT